MPGEEGGNNAWTIPFNPVDPDGRVISEEAARKLVRDRITFSRRLEHCMQEARNILDSREAGELRNNEQTQFWVVTTERYRCEASEHQHRCARLAEYIVHLHSVLSVPGAEPRSLPPMPEEIVHYVDYERQNAGVVG